MMMIWVFAKNGRHLCYAFEPHVNVRLADGRECERMFPALYELGKTWIDKCPDCDEPPVGHTAVRQGEKLFYDARCPRRLSE